MSQLTEYETRLQRLQQLKEAGVIPYANKYDKQYDIGKLVEIGSPHPNPLPTAPLGEGAYVSNADVLMKEGATQQYRTAGRMMSFRTMGRLSFATIRDGSADIQICFVKGLCKFHTGREIVESIHIDGLDRNAYKFAEKFLDIGDFVGVAGELFVTKHGELTLFVDEYQLLSKALRPLGDKRHGIQDEEKKYRQRYLDMTMNPDSYKTFKLRAQFLKSMREFYRSRGFDELDTPILGNAASGAAAKPFETHHEDFDTDVVLRIAPEIALKMATVGRFEKIFEIGRNFRNEGSSPAHMQEFTVVEHYCVYWNFEDNMKFMEEMFDHLIKACDLSIETEVMDKLGNSKLVNRSTPRQRIDYIQAVNKATGLDISIYTESDAETLRSEIQKMGHSREGIEKQSTATMIDYLYKKVLRPTIVGPAFVYNYPKTMQPLARQSDADDQIVEQFQVVVNGREICKAYSELVDPVIQQANFDEQAGALAAGDDEATSGDDDFVHCMEYGMPCQSGFGMGIERVLTFFTGDSNIRDVVMFPLMKPDVRASLEGIEVLENLEEEDESSGEKDWNGKEFNEKTNAIIGYAIDIHKKYKDTITEKQIKKMLADKLINEGFQVEIEKTISIEEDGKKFGNRYIDLLIDGDIIVELKKTIFEKDQQKAIRQAKNYLDLQGKGCALVLNFAYEKLKIKRLNYFDSSHSKSSSPSSSSKLSDVSSSQISLEKTVLSGETIYPYMIPGHDEVKAIMNEYLNDTKNHCIQVGEVMKYFAAQLGEDTQLRYTAGLLHDIDRDHISKDPENHLGEQFDAIMDKLGADDHLRRVIKSHYPDGTGIQPVSLIEKYLIAVDEMSGFLYAYSLMRPEGFTGMQPKGVKKRIKNKGFAAGVDREHLKNCETYLGISLDEFIPQMIEAMKSVGK